ncbi:MAG: pyridoxamine 5'-phosphate oxidase family protein [Gammaproteobacteria bacterium]|nr:pyridoxamine 5'-phosphate oxidase family protein [Gammaproteobacteria bacterium]MDH3466444.1 pyridoxamine 5'-phosphate oxidase family protein [Gammaproteobacteria bacterium]
MSRSECETLLSEPHIGVIGVERRNRAPMCVPMWYTYVPGGDVCIWTGRTSAKMRLMERYGRFSLCVQTGQPPYKFVSVEGRVSSLEVIDYDRHLRPLVYRYLGEQDGEKYLVEYGGPSAVTNDLWVRMTPEAWYSEDYSKS